MGEMMAVWSTYHAGGSTCTALTGWPVDAPALYHQPANHLERPEPCLLLGFLPLPFAHSLLYFFSSVFLVPSCFASPSSTSFCPSLLHYLFPIHLLSSLLFHSTLTILLGGYLCFPFSTSTSLLASSQPCLHISLCSTTIRSLCVKSGGFLLSHFIHSSFVLRSFISSAMLFAFRRLHNDILNFNTRLRSFHDRFMERKYPYPVLGSMATPRQHMIPQNNSLAMQYTSPRQGSETSKVYPRIRQHQALIHNACTMPITHHTSYSQRRHQWAGTRHNGACPSFTFSASPLHVFSYHTSSPFLTKRLKTHLNEYHDNRHDLMTFALYIVLFWGQLFVGLLFLFSALHSYYTLRSQLDDRGLDHLFTIILWQ